MQTVIPANRRAKERIVSEFIVDLLRIDAGEAVAGYSGYRKRYVNWLSHDRY
jgi:hypothetical protein